MPDVLLLLESVLPEAPIELVPPIEPVLLEGLVVLVDELVEVDGTVPSRFVQAPREKAATMARAAHVVFDAFIGKLLGICSKVRAVAP